MKILDQKLILLLVYGGLSLYLLDSFLPGASSLTILVLLDPDSLVIMRIGSRLYIGLSMMFSMAESSSRVGLTRLLSACVLLLSLSLIRSRFFRVLMVTKCLSLGSLL